MFSGNKSSVFLMKDLSLFERGVIPYHILQEGKEQALYFDAHVLDAQRRRHDVRGCRCRFLVRYDHDQSEVCITFTNCNLFSPSFLIINSCDPCPNG